MNILFVIALPIEARIIKSEIKKINFKNLKVDFLTTKSWTLNTTYHLTNYIKTKNKPDFIVNIWVCGKKYLKDSELIQAYKIQKKSDNKEVICPIYLDFWKLESLLCSDYIVQNKNDLWKFSFVDMESFWVDFVCSQENIPYIILKKPFDEVWKKSKNIDKKTLQKNLENICDYEKLIEKIKFFLEEFWNIEYKKIINLLKEKYKLSFTQTENLKKLINKKVALSKDESTTFKYFQKLDKEVLLKEINNISL